MGYSTFSILRNLYKIRDCKPRINDCYVLHYSKEDFYKFTIFENESRCSLYYLHPSRLTKDKNSFAIFNFDLFRIDITDNIDIIFNIEQYSDTELLLIFGKKFTDESLFGGDSYIVINYLEGLE